MGATLQFSACNAKTGQPMKVEVHVGGVFKGYTSDRKNQLLPVKMKTTGTFDWYARKWGKVVARGRSSGGNITIVVDPS